MTNRTQLILATGLVAAAAAAAYLSTPDASAASQESMDGHDHAAMMAGMAEAQPVQLTTGDAERIGVAFTRVASKTLTPEVRAVGVTTWDETRLRVVNPKIAGWVEALHVDFTGAPVRRGEPLLDVYSPDLITAQEELVLAGRLVREAGTERGRENATALLDAARRRLGYWDIPAEDVSHAEQMGHIRRSLTLYSPADGVVVDKQVIEGDRIAPGDILYRIADLSTVWVEVDVFERDLGSIREGQRAEVTFEAFPGESINAVVTYVYPTVSLDSRTGRVRLEIPNTSGRLRPGMYAEARIQTASTSAALVIPQSAVLETGERSLVFVEGANGRLVPRNVMLGQRVDREVVILDGLREGDRVVSSAAFLVDAESNLGALQMEPEAMNGMVSPSGGMGGMQGTGAMDHSGHDMGAEPDTAAMDHSGHDTGVGPDTTMSMDHSGHDMGPVRDTTVGSIPADTIDNRGR
jgi:Cu(I)/Ag(I) efflux system membrane fusion protein